jgi:4-hydroxy-3-polyprenylbenzoate decarboxylase
MTVPQRIVVGITGASGAIYGLRALELLKSSGVETHLVVTASGQITIAQELGRSPAEIAAIADVTYRIQDIGAAIASGSFLTAGMLIAPCSIRTLSEIATGVTASLLTRAADVMLKERRRLVLMVRETPFHLGHLRSMVQATEAGAIVMPPVPAFYPLPESLDEIVDHTIGRALDLFGIEAHAVRRWSGTKEYRSAE